MKMRHIACLLLPLGVMAVAGCQGMGDKQWAGSWQSADRQEGGPLHCDTRKVDKNVWQMDVLVGGHEKRRIEAFGCWDEDAVAFDEEVDLGSPLGVYQWFGRMTDTQFWGEYHTAQGIAGSFHMTRQ